MKLNRQWDAAFPFDGQDGRDYLLYTIPDGWLATVLNRSGDKRQETVAKFSRTSVRRQLFVRTCCLTREWYRQLLLPPDTRREAFRAHALLSHPSAKYDLASAPRATLVVSWLEPHRASTAY